MTVPASSAPAARAYLFGQLSAQLTPDPDSPRSSLLVCYDQPGPNQPDDIVSVGKVIRTFEFSSFVGSGGAGYLQERYTVEITVDVFRGGDDAQGAYIRAAYLTDQIVAAVRSDLTLGGAVLAARPTTHSTDAEWDDEHLGRHATATLEIECLQRI
ncbi:hypothetical protein [Actinacidiphila acididurans]|uniref:DUF3168 domain-containing protein n=1 Tax=Actinacidiphila acididurans TaxID=2784346 RepID=A0ABS2TMH6_9ACTN|nr:hypothetical protein [Actinacidiphila acididurans]MBM9504523.1 hypothetical protein [Actinacidiphila acididurans]